MFDEESLCRLRCPLSLGKLTLAEETLIERMNVQIQERGLLTRGGQLHREPIDGGLVTADRCHLYPIQGGIVSMLADNAIELEAVDETSA